MGSPMLIKESFLWWMSLVYFCAFASVYFQIPGLYGDEGILPVKLFLKFFRTGKNLMELMESKPTLLWLAPIIGCSVTEMMDIICLGGMAVSLFMISCQKAANSFNYLILWCFYFSIYQVGQTFLHFQWDILLLEAGFLAVLVAPLYLPFFRFSFYAHHDEITLWLVRWLFFRLMFASGVVKLTSLCPTWWGLSALNHHFESQCIPTPFAWLFHHFPDWFLKLSVISTFIIEIPIPVLFFSPIRSLRIFSYWSQVLLQVLIIFTGNYNFFNLLTLVLAISLLDNKFLSNDEIEPIERKPEGSKKKAMSSGEVMGKLLHSLLTLSFIGGIVWVIIELFSIRIRKDGNFSAKINFSADQFSSTLSTVIPITVWIGVISLTAHIFHSIYISLRVEGLISKLKSIVATGVMSCLVIFLFCITVVPHTSVDSSSHRSVWPVVRKWHNSIEKFELVHPYGLFRRMTGVNGRPEIVIEGSNSINSGWKEYEFYYKPGNVSASPKFVAPHQPRLDWQMWFAALGSYHHNPWFISLINCLLENKKDVVSLLQHNPFPEKPPKYIRAMLYTYKYTAYSAAERKNNDWWQRKNPTEYLPVLTHDNPSLKEYLQQAGLTQVSSEKNVKTNTTVVLQIIRGILNSMKASEFIWTVFFIAIIARYLS